MKKIAMFLILIILSLTSSGCFKRDYLEGASIHTTVYPINYVTDYLYGYNSNIDSIYPAEVDLSTYTLTEKQIRDYAKGSIFVYNGLSNERSIAKDLLNANNNIKIIDVSQGLEYEYSTVELWLNPSDFLMLAHNIKNGLIDYINNKYIVEEINANYDSLKMLISSYDAELEMMPENASSKSIIIANNSLSFLSKYGFDIVNIDTAESNGINMSASKAKKLIESKTNKYIYMLDTDEETDIIKELVASGAEIKRLRSMTILTENDVQNKNDYKTMMRDNISAIKEEMYK